jgi:transcriptional regulator with XRE-family HTH domain
VGSIREEFGARLREVRQSEGFTQRQLAEEIGLSVEAISNFERGVHAPSFDTLEDLSRALKTPVVEFFRFHRD